MYWSVYKQNMEERTKRKRDDLQTREELITRLTELENQNRELKERLSIFEHPQSVNKKAKKNNEPTSKKRKAFDFSRYNVRYIALKIAYLGWDYHGFASQENNENTIEAHLFNALQKACLIKDRSTCNYSRCGRTDKGVSAFAQVISLEVRSNVDEGNGVIKNKELCTLDNAVNKNQSNEEINYVHVLNKLLPDEIRVLAWTPVELDFKARFSCLYRMYKYYFPATNFDIERMNEAGKKFIGEHDFRNFCKMDVGNNVTSFCRNILSVDVQRLNNSGENEYEMCVITVKGMAFLWHQVRCMVAILFLVGQHLEEPEIIDHMLNITKCPRRPQYNMASEIPLVLFHCEYEGVNWQYSDTDELQRISNSYQRLWTTSSIKTTMMREILNGLHTVADQSGDCEAVTSCEEKTFAGMCLIPGHHIKSYKKILTRALCDSLETKLENLSAKQQRLKKKNLTD